MLETVYYWKKFKSFWTNGRTFLAPKVLEDDRGNVDGLAKNAAEHVAVDVLEKEEPDANEVGESDDEADDDLDEDDDEYEEDYEETPEELAERLRSRAEYEARLEEYRERMRQRAITHWDGVERRNQNKPIRSHPSREVLCEQLKEVYEYEYQQAKACCERDGYRLPGSVQMSAVNCVESILSDMPTDVTGDELAAWLYPKLRSLANRYSSYKDDSDDHLSYFKPTVWAFIRFLLIRFI